MKTLVQLRGTMATGKTATARSVIEHGDFTVEMLDIGGKKYPNTIDRKKNWIVTGRYDTRVCGGLDGVITNRDVLKVYLHRLMKELKPEVIVFEAIMYGHTYKFGRELAEICRSDGYKYIGILLQPPLDRVLQNIYNRNGGKPVNEKYIVDRYFSAHNSTVKYMAEGLDCHIVDTSEYELGEMYRIVEQFL